MLDTDPNDLIVTFARRLGDRPELREPARAGSSPRRRPGQKLITLTTCAELFHTDNRMIAFGHLVDTTREPQADRHGDEGLTAAIE